jgi:uncharacterized protein
MSARKILVDSGYLIALANRHDNHYQAARKYAQNSRISDHIILDVVLTEATYGIRKFVGKPAEIEAVKLYATANHEIMAVQKSDLLRVHSIMTQYPQFDFVDCCILAIAERETITRLCTFDRRDFEAFKPAHCEYLELLP